MQLSQQQLYLSLLFSPEESICVSNDQFGVRLFPADRTYPNSEFVALNPLKDSRKDKNVLSYRNFLVELDSGTLDEQQEYIKLLELPFSCCVYSGGKSLHFIISLNTPVATEEEYREISRKLLMICKKADQSTKNPSRFTRLPGVKRKNTNKYQELLSVGAKISQEELNRFFEKHKAVLNSKVELNSNPIKRSDNPWANLKNFTKKFLREGYAPKGRNNTMYAASLDMLEAGYSMYDVSETMRALGPKISLNPSEITSILNSVRSKVNEAT